METRLNMLKSKQTKLRMGTQWCKEEFYTDSYSKRPAFAIRVGSGACCCIPNCSSTTYNERGQKSCIDLLKFPSDKTLSNQWNELFTTFEGGNVTKICLKSVTGL